MGFLEKHPPIERHVDWYVVRALSENPQSHKPHLLCAACFTRLDAKNWRSTMRCKGCNFTVHAHCSNTKTARTVGDMRCSDCAEFD